MSARSLCDPGPGCSTPPWMSLAHSTFRDLGAGALIDALVGYLGLPLMVKPQHGGSALGAGVVRTGEGLPAALVGAFAYGEIVIVERFVAVSYTHLTLPTKRI